MYIKINKEHFFKCWVTSYVTKEELTLSNSWPTQAAKNSACLLYNCKINKRVFHSCFQCCKSGNTCTCIGRDLIRHFWDWTVFGTTLKSFINTVVWVQGMHRVANGTVLIVEYITYYIFTCAFKNSVFSCFHGQNIRIW